MSERSTPLGAFIRQRRQELNLTQEQLATAIGTSRAYVCQIETTKGWPKTYIHPLANALRVSVDDLSMAAKRGCGMSERMQEKRLVVTFRTERGEAGAIEHSLAGLATIDRADVEFVVKKAEQELRRLDASRLFNGQQHRGR